MRERKSEIPKNLKIVALNIKRLMSEKDMKASEVAIKSQIDIETFRKYTGGPNGPSIVMGLDKFIRIGLALDLADYNELFKGINENEIDKSK